MSVPSKECWARKGIVDTQLAVHCKERTSLSAADQVFDAIPSTGVGAELNIRQVLSVTVHNMLHPVTLSVLHRVFGAYGVVLNLSVVGKLGWCEVLVQFNTCESAAKAMECLQGRYIYDGCCQLDIKAAEQSQLSALETSSSMQRKQPSVTTTPKQVPTFDGTNMNKWRADCEEFFEMYKIPQVMWILAAKMNMIGDAALWLQAHKTRHVIKSWEDLCVAMLQEFGPGTDRKLQDSADEHQYIGHNQIINVQSAPSQDSVCNAIRVNPMHCPISKEDKDEVKVDDKLTHVGRLSLSLELDLDSANKVFEDAVFTTAAKMSMLSRLFGFSIHQQYNMAAHDGIPWDPGGVNG